MKGFCVTVLVLILAGVHSQNPFPGKDQNWPYNLFEPLKGELHDCQNPEKVAHYKSNVEIKLCCKSAKSNTSLTISKVGVDAGLMHGWKLTNNGTSSVRLTISSPQRSDSGMYACYSDGEPIDKMNLSIIDNVDAPHILSVITTIDGKLTVQFKTGTVSNVMKDVYNVIKEPGGVVLCKNETISCKRETCTCSGRIQGVKDRNVTIIVRKTRSVQEIETNQTLNLIEHIKPSQVTGLKVVRKYPRSARLRFCSPEFAFLVMYDMQKRNKPLGVSVTLVKTQGFYEERKFKVFFKNSDYECLWIQLLQLTPFTRYNLSVTAFSGVESSIPLNEHFITRREAPLSPPKDISYWMVEDRKEISGSLEVRDAYSININWKPVPHDEKGGKITYEITVTDCLKLNITFHQEKTKNTFTVVRKIPDTALCVKIYSTNKMGRSKSFSFIIEKYSKNSDINRLESHAEINGNKAKFFIERPESPVNISAIYWCIGHQESQLGMPLTCKEYPQMISSFNENGDLDERYGLIHAVAKLETRECPKESSLVAVTETAHFSLLDKSKIELSEDITVNVLRNETTSCSFASSHSVELNLLKMDEYIKQGMFHKFMFSVERQGVKLSRLFPFKCYYDNKYDYARLNIHENYNGSNVFIKWKQYCDSIVPHQFLAQNYRVYTSKDNECPPGSRAFKKVDNKIMQFSEYKIPQQNSFVCIEIFKSSESKTSSQTIFHEVNEAIVHKEDSYSPFWLFFLVILVIPVIIMIIKCQKKTLKSRRNVQYVFENIPHPWKETEESPKQSEELSKQTATYHFEDKESGISSKPESDSLGVDRYVETQVREWENITLSELPTTETNFDWIPESGFDSGSSIQNSEKCFMEENIPSNAQSHTEDQVEILNAVARCTNNQAPHSLLSVQERLKREFQKQLTHDI